jgi:hypothetical protein
MALLSASGGVLYASTGSIDSTDKYAWGTIGGWTNFNPTNGNVVVSDSVITGYAWSANDGWINFAPTNGGVHNDGNGNLSGFAWDTTNGWISFQGVTIDSNGLFHGQATGVAADGSDNIITFDCTHCRVVTTWRPSGATPPASSDTKKRSSNNVHEPTGNSDLAVYPTTAPVTPIEPPASQAVPGLYTQNQNSAAGNRTAAADNRKTLTGTRGDASSGSSITSTSSKNTQIQARASTTSGTTPPGHRPGQFKVVTAIVGGIALLIVLFFLMRMFL